MSTHRIRRRACKRQKGCLMARCWPPVYSPYRRVLGAPVPPRRWQGGTNMYSGAAVMAGGVTNTCGAGVRKGDCQVVLDDLRDPRHLCLKFLNLSVFLLAPSRRRHMRPRRWTKMIHPILTPEAGQTASRRRLLRNRLYFLGPVHRPVKRIIPPGGRRRPLG